MALCYPSLKALSPDMSHSEVVRGSDINLDLGIGDPELPFTLCEASKGHEQKQKVSILSKGECEIMGGWIVAPLLLFESLECSLLIHAVLWLLSLK